MPFTLPPKNKNDDIKSKDPKSFIFSMDKRKVYKLRNDSQFSTFSQKGFIASFGCWKILDKCNKSKESFI